MKKSNKLKRKFKNMCSGTFSSEPGKNKKIKKGDSLTSLNESSANMTSIDSQNDRFSSKNCHKVFNSDVKFRNFKSNNGSSYLIEKNKSENVMTNNALPSLTSNGSTGSNNWEKFLIKQGKKFVIDNNPREYNSKIKPIPSNFNKNNKLTKVVSMDCEMVGTGEDGKDNLVARVSIVNLSGDCLYDKFVKPKENVTDYRTHISGVRAADLKHADDFETVQKEVADLIKGRILVGHAIKNDLEVLFLSHPRHQIRDTAKFFRKKGCGTPSLKNLAAEYLGVKIQSGEHSSIQDAQAAVQLYNMFRKQWETGGGNKKNNRIDTAHK